MNDANVFKLPLKKIEKLLENLFFDFGVIEFAAADEKLTIENAASEETSVGWVTPADPTGDSFAVEDLDAGHATWLRMRIDTKKMPTKWLQIHRDAAEKARQILVEHRDKLDKLAAALEREDAVPFLRQVMGATNPAEAAPGTIRADHAKTVDENAVHGSDGPDTAAVEIAFFFPDGVCERTR